MQNKTWRGKTTSQRLEEKCIPEPNSGCWLWLAHTNAKGYGTFRSTLAHRASYLLHKGPIRSGEVDHKCNNRLCVSPDHLEVVTHQENVARSYARGRKHHQFAHGDKSHCPRGHPYSGDNLYTYPGPRKHRACRACLRAHGKRADAKRRGYAAIAGELAL